jgi:hypothetical protein
VVWLEDEGGAGGGRAQESSLCGEVVEGSDEARRKNIFTKEIGRGSSLHGIDYCINSFRDSAI